MEKLFNKIYRQLNQFFEKRLAKWLPDFITPNMVTVSRVFFVGPIIGLLFAGQTALSATLFIFASLLDYVDGALARGRRAESELGKFLDPISDKIFFCVISMMVSVAIFSNSPTTIATICLLVHVNCAVCVELLLTCIRVLDFCHNQNECAKNKKNLKADWSGKIKFNLQMFGAGLALIVYPGDPSSPVIWFAIACIALSLPFATISLARKIHSR